MSYPSANMPIDFGDAVTAAMQVGWSRTFGIGYNPDVDIASVPEDAWGGSGPYPWITTVGGVSLEILGGVNDVNLTGTGAWTVLVSGLDDQFNPKTATATLTGATPVALGPGWFRINSIRVLTANRAALGTNGSDIIVRDAGAGTVRGIILAGKGTTRQAPVTVPAGMSLNVKQIYVGADSATGAVNKFVRVETYFAAPAPAAIILPLTIGNTNNTPYNHLIDPPIAVAEKTDFALRINLVSDNDTIVSAAWNGILRRNK